METYATPLLLLVALLRAAKTNVSWPSNSCAHEGCEAFFSGACLALCRPDEEGGEAQSLPPGSTLMRTSKCPAVIFSECSCQWGSLDLLVDQVGCRARLERQLLQPCSADQNRANHGWVGGCRCDGGAAAIPSSACDFLVTFAQPEASKACALHAVELAGAEKEALAARTENVGTAKA